MLVADNAAIVDGVCSVGGLQRVGVDWLFERMIEAVVVEQLSVSHTLLLPPSSIDLDVSY